MQYKNSASFADTKPHYALLDGLRGVAALLVVWYHIFEGFAFAGGGEITTLNHGYLAVDFFFMLSGFVISYAYDDRWGKSLTLGNFAKRRLIRLHPMVMLGAVIGVVFFLLQGGVKWDGTAVPWSLIGMSLAMGMLLIPVLPGASCEIRGNGEMFPLNGPSWSLFFEYIGNILYALLIRRFSTKTLAIWTAFLGVGLAWFTIFDVAQYGCLSVGWTLDGLNFLGGMLRLLFPFSLGMLLARCFTPMRIRGAFWLCALVLIVLFHVPYLASSGRATWNGMFEMACIALAFPAVLWLGASGTTTDVVSTRVCKFLGDISFPIYIIHYPMMYLFYSWLIKNKLYTLGETWPVALLVVGSSLVVAYLCLRFYDVPVRRWLRRRFMGKN